MITLLAMLSIKWRISLGFAVLSIFILAISALALWESNSTRSFFEKYERMNKQATRMMIIDNKVISTQRAVLQYVHTGYDAVAEKAHKQLQELSVLLAQIQPSIAGDTVADGYLKKMNAYLNEYSKTFEFAVEEIHTGKQLLQSAQANFLEITNSQGTPKHIRDAVLIINSSLYTYLTDPDLKLIKSSVNTLDSLIATSISPLTEKLYDYKKHFLNVVQSTRGHLFLVTVVMAGAAQEFDYYSSGLKGIILERKESSSHAFQGFIGKIHTVVLVTASVLIMLALALSYLISHSIIKPLGQITATFEHLANNQPIGKIPGIHLQDEIGKMSKAADTFRLNNEKTRILAGDLSIERSNLERSNKELEQFARITSHDLQEPLRTIKSFAELFNKEYKDDLDKTGLKYMSFIEEASSRMHSLIHGVLEYSQIGKTSSLEVVDLNQLVSDTMKDLTAAIDQKSATVTVSELPSVEGNPLELRSLFMNLLSNALKFVPPERMPEVEVGFGSSEHPEAFFVHDNGVGIDSDQMDKAFQIFQRMQDRRDYPGHGIGLAHCKKIVESHKGEIWIESEKGESCSFFFTLGALNRE